MAPHHVLRKRQERCSDGEDCPTPLGEECPKAKCQGEARKRPESTKGVSERTSQSPVYYWVRIKEVNEWKTAFNCPLGGYQFKVMPLGLQGAPAVFMQLIKEVLHEHFVFG